MDISIILVSYNTAELTRNCLKSVYEKTDGITFDVWVVDNNSADNSVEMIKSEFPQVNVIASPENLGYGRANNLAISKVNSKYVLLLNTDTVLLNNAVKLLFDFMENPENANVGACGGQLYNRDMTYQNSFGEFDHIDDLRRKALGINFKKLYHRLLNIMDKKFGNQEVYRDYKAKYPHEVDYIIGADVMLRKSVIDKTGVFDERFFMFGEEAEMQFRIKKAGCRIVFTPGPEIIHYGGASSYNVNKRLQVEKMLLESNILFYRMCYGIETAKKAKFFHTVYHLRYFILRFFSPKAFRRLKQVLELKVE